jgi:sigma-B regulation protein RsbU (phosphoserine phosphatase)
MNTVIFDYHFSSAWIRLILSIILLFSASMLKKATGDTTRKKNVEFLQWLAVMLAVKETACLATLSTWLPAVSDVLTVSAYYYFTVNNTGEKKIDPYYYRGILLFHIFILFYYKDPSAIAGSRLYSTFAILNSILFGIRLFISHEKKSPMIIRLRIPASLIFSTFSVAVFFTGYDQAYIAVIIMPLIYLLHLYLLYLNSESEYRYRAKAIKFMKEERASTYEFFESIGRVMHEKKNIDEVNEYIISTIIEKSGAESGAVLLYDDYNEQLYISASAGNFIFPCTVDDKIKTDINCFREFFKKEKYIPAGTLIDETFRKGEPLFIPDFFRMRHDPLCRENTGNNLVFISSIIMIPLEINGRASGMICIEHNTPGRYFTDEVSDIVTSLSVYAEIMIANISVHREIIEKRELDRDISITSGIQKSLLPSNIPSSDQYAFAVYSEPARYVSGDYYDFIKLKSGRIAFLICDVADKGVAAGLVMTVIRTIVHLIANQEWKTSSIMKMINRGILDIGGDHFATAMFLVYDPETGELEYSNAAHLPAVLFKSSSSDIIYLDTEGLPFGIDRKSDYKSSAIHLDRGDILLLYTDGINETMNPRREQYGRERISDLLIDNSALTAGDISSLLAESLKNFSGEAPQHDDQTFVILKIPEENLCQNPEPVHAVI